MAQLQEFLFELRNRYHRPDFLDSDPIGLVRRYSDPWDQEAVALVASQLAYGNVKIIRNSVTDVFSRIAARGYSPAAFVKRLPEPGGKKLGTQTLGAFVHRMNVGGDIVRLLWSLGKTWKKFGSLGNLFLKLNGDSSTIEAGISGVTGLWRSWHPEAPTSFKYLLSSPEQGSACKRWCMFLRWMGRNDEMDPGLWAKGIQQGGTVEGRLLKPEQLLMPLDTHTARISRYIRLTDKKTVNWKMVLEVTERLRLIDSRDPISFDFALSRLGILKICRKQYRKEICSHCSLLNVCQFAAHHAEAL